MHPPKASKPTRTTGLVSAADAAEIERILEKLRHERSAQITALEARHKTFQRIRHASSFGAVLLGLFGAAAITFDTGQIRERIHERLLSGQNSVTEASQRPLPRNQVRSVLEKVPSSPQPTPNASTAPCDYELHERIYGPPHNSYIPSPISVQPLSAYNMLNYTPPKLPSSCELGK